MKKMNVTDTYDRTAKPIAQAPCDLPSQHQFNDETEYIELRYDQWKNEIPVDWSNHREPAAAMGQFGNRQFGSNTQELQGTVTARTKG